MKIIMTDESGRPEYIKNSPDAKDAWIIFGSIFGFLFIFWIVCLCVLSLN